MVQLAIWLVAATVVALVAFVVGCGVVWAVATISNRQRGLH